MKESYTPIDEANTDRVKFFLPLPEYVDRKQIGVNLTKIERLCKLGGIQALLVTGSSDKETSSFAPNVVSLNEKGEAVAGKAGSKNLVPLHSKDIRHIMVPGFPSFMTSAARIDINLNEAVDRAINETKGKASLRDTETWTKYLDVSIKESLRQIGNHNLLEHGRKSFIYASALGVGISFFVAATGHQPHNPDALEIARSFFIQHQFLNLWDNMSGKYLHGLGDYRWSLTYGIQPDRAIALTFIANRGNLIKALPKSEK